MYSVERIYSEVMCKEDDLHVAQTVHSASHVCTWTDTFWDGGLASVVLSFLMFLHFEYELISL